MAKVELSTRFKKFVVIFQREFTYLQPRDIFIVPTRLRKTLFLRTTFVNPFTNKKILEELIKSMFKFYK